MNEKAAQRAGVPKHASRGCVHAVTRQANEIISMIRVKRSYVVICTYKGLPDRIPISTIHGETIKRENHA
jgi:hypothetical protein